MGTYVISDIHGQLDAFKRLLDKVNFKLDGTDELHILGDIVDWGDKSIEALLFIKQLNEKYDFIQVYKGNHEDLMFNGLLNGGRDLDLWAVGNGGSLTYQQFMLLDLDTQAELMYYIRNLRYFNADVKVNNQRYYLTHSSPYTELMTSQFEDPYQQMIWNRPEHGKGAFNALSETERKNYKGHILINGHTIVDRFNSFDEDRNLVIYKSKRDRKICIDCGGKGLGRYFVDRTYRLALLRLDDMAEFYEREV